jgi:hypothetical protein
LVLVSDDHERCLPADADGAVEVYPGNDGFEAYGYEAEGHSWAYLPGTASFRFLPDEPEVVAFADEGVGPDLVQDAYLRNILPLVMQVRGYEVLHASAVGAQGGLIVLCGVSGAGKSTLAAALSARGHAVRADDAVVLDVDGEVAEAVGVPFRLGLRSEAAVFVGPVPQARGGAEARPRTPILALLVLGPDDPPDGSIVVVRRLEPAAAFTALLPHAYYFRLSDSDRNAAMLDRYLRLASSVRTFEVRYRRGFDHLSAVLDEIEDRVQVG